MKQALLILCSVVSTLAVQKHGAPADPKTTETAAPVKDNKDPVTKKMVLPSNLSDGNQDGRVDEHDFIRAWANLVRFF